MRTHTQPTPTLPLRAARATLTATLGICLLTASAHLKVPFAPVPLTLQTLAVLLLGAATGPRMATATVAAYLAIGAAGAPVFAGGAGLAALAGPTGGFLLGFLPAAAAAAWLSRAVRTRIPPPRTVARLLAFFAALAAADAVIFACGIAQLAVIAGDLPKAIALGLTPFAAGELAKLTLAATLLTLATRRQ